MPGSNEAAANLSPCWYLSQ